MKKRSLKLVWAILALSVFAWSVYDLAITNDCHVIRTYEIDGLTYVDYVSGENSFRKVYIEDVPAHVLKGEK